MEETKFWKWMVKYLPIIGGIGAIVAPTTVSIAIFISVLSLNAGMRKGLAEQGAAITGLRVEIAAMRADIAEQRTEIRTQRAETSSDIQSLRSEIQALRSDTRSDIQALRAETSSEILSLRSEVRALTVDVNEVKLDVVQIKGRVENIERRLPDVESVGERLDGLELGQAKLNERVDALYAAE